MWISKDKFTKLNGELETIKKQLQGHFELNREYQAALQRKPQEIVRHVVITPPSNRIETAQYLQQLKQLCEGQWFIHFFEELKREGMEQFAAGKESPDYWRGWLSLIGKIFGEARNCKPLLNKMALEDEQTAKEGVYAEV